MVELDAFADGCRLANYRAGAVIDKKMRADGCARVQVHARMAVGPFGHDARDQLNTLAVQHVCQSLHRDGLDERVRHDDLLLAFRRRVSIKRRIHVGRQHLAHLRQFAQKFHGQLPRCRARIGLGLVIRGVGLDAL